MSKPYVSMYTIPYTSSVHIRWTEILESHAEVLFALLEQIKTESSEIPRLLKTSAGWLLHLIYRYSGGLYYDEMQYIAYKTKQSVSSIVAVNCSYELSHLYGGFKPLGCTAGVTRHEKHGNIHVRNMDWPWSCIADATIVVRSKTPTHDYVSVTVPGMVGALSGMVPGAYSVTLNWAPSSGVYVGWSPLMLLRHTLETCKTYEEAKQLLSTSRTSSSVFYMLNGVDKACVIERTPKTYVVRNQQKERLVVANHYAASAMREHNAYIHAKNKEGASVYTCSHHRYTELYRNLDSTHTVTQLRSALNQYPVKNDDTRQQMLMIPKEGMLEVWNAVYRRTLVL